jgi:CubicO group peptidase (beta-lactamase class C family)
MRSTSWTFDELNSKRVSLIYVQNAEKSPTGVAEYPQYYVTGYPPSGLKTDTTDLAIWVREMIRGYHGNGKLLAKESYRTLFEPQFKSGNLSRARPGELLNGGDIAIIWMISKNGDYFHLGGNIGVAAFVRFDPQRHTGSVSIANLRDADFGLIQEIVTRYEPLLGAPSRK